MAVVARRPYPRSILSTIPRSVHDEPINMAKHAAEVLKSKAVKKLLAPTEPCDDAKVLAKIAAGGKAKPAKKAAAKKAAAKKKARAKK